MTRSIPTIVSGALVGTNNVQEIYNVLTQQITEFQSNGESAWQLLDEITSTSGSRDRVYKSVGDRNLGQGVNIGDADIIARLSETASAIRLQTYTDWSATSSTGNRESTSVTFVSLNSISATANIDWWIIVNEYGWVFQSYQSGAPDTLFCEQPKPFVPPGFDGRCRIRTTTTGSGLITVEVDRDVSGVLGQAGSLQPGQSIFIMNRTPDGANLLSEQIEIAKIESVTSGSINISNVVSSSYSSGSLIAHDPAAFVGTYTTNLAAVFYCSFGPEASYTVSQVQAFKRLMALPTETDQDPNFTGFWPVSSVIYDSSQSGHTGPRGTSQLFLTTPDSLVASGTKFIHVDKGQENLVVFFPQVTTTNANLALGPANNSDRSNINGLTIPTWSTTEDVVSGTQGIYSVHVDSIDYMQDDAVLATIYDVTAGSISDIAAPVRYYQRALDSGTGGFVYWFSSLPNSNPNAYATSPNFTGTLSLYSIIAILS